MLHGIKADRAALKGALHSGLYIRDPECLQQPQNLNELAFSLWG
jgi:hypothetical protein